MSEIFIWLSSIAEWAFKIYYWVHIAAIIFSWIRADPHNSVVAFVNRCTFPVWAWIHDRVPKTLSPMAPYLALISISFAEFTVPGIFRTFAALLSGKIEMGSGVLNIVYYFIIGFGQVVDQILMFIIILSLAWFVITIVNPPLNNLIVRSIMVIIDPLITPLQKILPRSKIDLSPLLLFGIAYLISHLLSRYIIYSFAAKLIA